jgi:hypothetical protein
MGRKTHRERKLSGRQKSAEEIHSRRGEIIATVIVIELGFIGIIIIIIIITTSTIITTLSYYNILGESCLVHRGNFPDVNYYL